MQDSNIGNPELNRSLASSWEEQLKSAKEAVKKGEVPAEINIEMKIPAAKDNISVTFVVNTETLQIDGFSFKADSPEIYPPRVSPETDQTPENQNQATKYWSRIEVSFMGAFLSVMIDLFNVQLKTAFNEAQGDLKQRELKIAITTTISELTKLLGESQANEKMMEAMGSFMQAGLGAIQLASMTRNVATAGKMVNDKTAAAKTKLDAEEAKAPLYGVDNKPFNQLTPDEKKDLFKKTPELKAATDNYNDLVFGRETHIQNELRRLDQMDATRFEVLKNIVNATIQTVGATFKTEQGSIQALKETEQGYHDAAQTNMQDAQKNRDAIESSINKLLDLLKSLFDMNIRSKMFKG